MSATPISPRAVAPLALALLAATATCGSPFSLPPANLGVPKGTVTLWALNGTDLAEPSAYDVMLQTVARTDRTSAFDFAFDVRVDSLNDTTAVLLPRGSLGLSIDGGLQLTQQVFDSITIAPTGGYIDSLPVAVKAGNVLFAASRQETCNFGYIKPLYAKLHVTALDLAARTITFDIVTDPNCGYRSLKVDTIPPTY